MTGYRRGRSTPCFASGCDDYPTLSPSETVRAGYRYQLSILQLELSLTQVLDQPVSGRIFFEDVIRENLDIGRPKQVQLIFDRWVTKATPGPFRTRVIIAIRLHWCDGGPGHRLACGPAYHRAILGSVL